MARDHTPSKSLGELQALESWFHIENTRALIARVGGSIAPRLHEEAYSSDVVAPPEEMLVAQLAFRLNNAAVEWGFDEREQTDASAAMKIQLARRLSQDCRRLLGDMTGSDGALLPSLGPGGLHALAALQGGSGSSQVSRAMTAVRDLQRWAEGMASRHEAVELQREVAIAGRPTDRAFNNLLAALGGIFVLFWNRAPGVSRPDQVNPDGPFFRFVAAVASELGLSKTNEALATAISRHADLRALCAALNEGHRPIGL